jgi:hypothetical protein
MLAVILLVAAGCMEALLRFLDFRELRDGYGRGYPIVFQHDAELGWFPIPNSVAQFQGSRIFNVAHNSLGLRDVELEPNSSEGKSGDVKTRPTVLFIGDSFVWGYDVEAKDRFTELLRKDLPGTRIVNAGIPGYGTAQEYLLFQRLWDTIKPDVVVLVVCTDNDRDDNSSNRTSNGYFRPYLEQSADGGWRFAGQPVPRSRQAYFNGNALVHHSWLARLAVTAFVQARYLLVEVSDPTEQLVGMMRDLVEARGAKLLVGMTAAHLRHLPLEAYLQREGIRSLYFGEAEIYRVDGGHWTPHGHAEVASLLRPLLQAPDMLDTPQAEHVGALGPSAQAGP